MFEEYIIGRITVKVIALNLKSKNAVGEKDLVKVRRVRE